jgi:hypothetical protein
LRIGSTDCEPGATVGLRGDLVCEGDHRGPGSVLELDAETLEVKRDAH